LRQLVITAKMNQQMKKSQLQQGKTAAAAAATKMVAQSKPFLILLVAVIVSATFLSSIFFPVTPSSLDGIKSERKLKSNAIENYKDSVLAKDTRLALLTSSYDATNDLYKVKRKSEFVFGFPSLHKFLWNFGTGLIILALSVYLLLTVNMYKGDKKKAANVASMMFITVSGFYMAWIFFPENDLPLRAYFTVLFVIGILSATTAYFINKINYLTIANLKSKIRMVMDKLLEGRDYAKDRREYTEKIITSTIKKLND
jgi:hypothetical protein